MSVLIDTHEECHQDFADGCFQPRASRASQSLGLADLAESLTRCRVMGLSHRGGDLHVLDGQLSCRRFLGVPVRPAAASGYRFVPPDCYPLNHCLFKTWSGIGLPRCCVAEPSSPLTLVTRLDPVLVLKQVYAVVYAFHRKRNFPQELGRLYPARPFVLVRDLAKTCYHAQAFPAFHDGTMVWMVNEFCGSVAMVLASAPRLGLAGLECTTGIIQPPADPSWRPCTSRLLWSLHRGCLAAWK